MATTKTTKAAPTTAPRSLNKSIGIFVGEALDGHIDLMKGFNAARDPAVVEHRAIRNQQEIDQLVAELLAE